VFLVNSRLGRFSEASGRSGSESRHGWKHPFSRSYGVTWPSSLTRVLSSALGCSPRLPVSVCGTVSNVLARGFSRQHGISRLKGFPPSSSPLGVQKVRIFLNLPPTGLNHHFRPVAGLPSCVTPSLERTLLVQEYLTCYPSATPFGLALGAD
jgi:hypothetical protein